ncbi:MAG: hypothetical protein PQJ46_06280 [Spirochaetales bacterium]|nr:hypothetical protein [Spirochaetales bacterium]
MDSKIKKYLKILTIELEDLVVDLTFNEKIIEQRLKRHEITEYVFRENVSLIKKEIIGIGKIKKLIKTSSKGIKSIESFREIVENYFKVEIEAAGIPDVVMLLVNRKLDKVEKYINIEDDI